MTDPLPILAAVVVALLVAMAEALHARRIHQAAPLLAGTGDGRFRSGRVAACVAAVARTASVAAVAWGGVVLLKIEPKTHAARDLPIDPDDAEPERHVIYAIDVSPSMTIRDAGPGDQSRSQRAAQVLLATLADIDFERTRVSVIPFFTDAKTAVVETFDAEVARNAIDGLPFNEAFESGTTDGIAPIAAAFELAASWPAGSTSVVVCTDGDATPPRDLPKTPSAVDRLLLVGIGSTTASSEVDGHSSRQERDALAALAGQLGGEYFNANSADLPRRAADFVRVPAAAANPLEDLGLREWALLSVAGGSMTLVLIPVGLSIFDVRRAR